MRMLNSINAKVSWTVQNLMPPYAIDVPIWTDTRSFDSVMAHEVSGVLHEGMLKNDRLLFNEATIDTSVAAIVQTMMMGGFTPAFIAEIVHPCNPDLWRAFQASTQLRRILKLQQLHANRLSKNPAYVCANNDERTIRNPGGTPGIVHQQTSWAQTPAQSTKGMMHPF